MRMLRPFLLGAAVAVLSQAVVAAPAQAASDPQPIHARFSGKRSASAPNTGTVIDCQEFDGANRSLGTCDVSFEVTRGSITCGGFSTSVRGTADYTSHLLGRTFSDVPLSGLWLNDAAYLRGTVLTGTTLLDIEISLGDLCTVFVPQACDKLHEDFQQTCRDYDRIFRALFDDRKRYFTGDVQYI